MRGLTGNGVLDVALAGQGQIARGRFVRAVDAHTVATAGAGDPVVGVALEALDPARGEQGVLVRMYGIAEVVAGSAIAAGAEVQSDAQGRAVPLGTGKRAGIALASAPAAGHLVPVLLK